MLARIYDRVLDFGRHAAIAMVLFMMVAMSARVIIRWSSGISVNWMVDLSRIFQLYLTFLAAAWLLREEGHISLDVVFAFIRARRWFAMQVVNSLLCALICAVILVFGAIETWSSWKLDLDVGMPIGMPKWTVLAAIPAGSLLLMLQLLRRARDFMIMWRDCPFGDRRGLKCCPGGDRLDLACVMRRRARTW